MEHSIALLTGTTSGFGYVAARTLAREGWRMITAAGVEASQAQLIGHHQLTVELLHSASN